MTGFFQDKTGDKSMMRLLAFMGFFLGAGVAIGGLTLGMESAVLAGCGLAAGGEIMKGLQKKFEK